LSQQAAGCAIHAALASAGQIQTFIEMGGVNLLAAVRHRPSGMVAVTLTTEVEHQ
jgi:hypothetical protein